MTRDELIAALRATSEGSRKLDFWCWWYGISTEAERPIPYQPDEDYVLNKMAWWYDENGPSRSVDWALRMIPEGWFLWMLREMRKPRIYRGDRYEPLGRYECDLQLVDGGGKLQHGEAATPALAICVAALEARKL